jgi:hypothetical protein
MNQSHDTETAHETSDVNVRAIFGLGLGLVIIGIAVHVLVLLLFTVFAGREAQRTTPRFPLAVSDRNQLPPEPRLQTNPRQDLRDLRSQEDAILGSYGWVDKTNGVVRIPIDRAMTLTIERGLPARQDAAQSRK